MDNDSYIIEVAPNGMFVLTLPDDSIKEADNLEEIFDIIRTFFTNSLIYDENLFKL